ncbi:Hypothetical predicted protein [Olea europaea subsp. europaea]|uniref:Uncharacterized protein n=1 Tax=Olea europaea subsp. europaea TaxID=158383 RepID=A0A8S0V0L8_OLEEU|nr:Hypothetical predicted protein [Olea europaea subsp. europaea]
MQCSPVHSPCANGKIDIFKWENRHLRTASQHQIPKGIFWPPTYEKEQLHLQSLNFVAPLVDATIFWFAAISPLPSSSRNMPKCGVV